MKHPVGTIGWATAGGALRRQDRIRLAGQALLLRLGALPKSLRLRLGFSDAATAQIDAGAIWLPDSVAAVRAFEHAKALSEPWLFSHCLRTYTWGAMIAQRHQISFDHELLFVASALHVLGLTDSHDPETRRALASPLKAHGPRTALLPPLAGTTNAAIAWQRRSRCI